MVIRNTPKDINKYIMVSDDNAIYQLSLMDIYPLYIDNETAYFKKEQLTLDIINDILAKGEIEHWKK